MIALLEATSTQRRLWINKENPPVSEILEKFPCFEEPKLMIKEFCAITGCTEDNIIPNFANLEQRVLHFAALKSKKSVSTLASLYRHCHNTKTTALMPQRHM